MNITEKTIERAIDNVKFKKSQEPKQIGNTPMFLIENEENEYHKLVIGRFILTDQILNEEIAIQWAKDNILDVVPTIVIAMLETQKKILETINE